MYLTAVSGSIVLLRLLIAGQATSIHQNFTSLSTLVHGHDIGLRSLQSESHDHGSCSRMLHSKRELSEPSTRCSNRYEWKGECKWWPGGPSTRYVEVTKSTREGIGSNLWKIASIYQRAIDFNLTPVLVGPFVVGHHTGDIGDWMGFTGNPAVKPIDPVGLQRAQRHRVPMPDENVDSWLLSQMSLTDVVYVPDMYRLEGWPRTWGGSWALIMNHCSYAWEALRSIFWGVPHKRDRCKSIVLRNKTRIDESHVPLFTTGLVSDSRPWVIGVHIRRGDIMMKETKHEVLPHTFFVTAVRSVLVGITASDPESRIIIFIFSEGPQELEEKNMILDENATPVEWNIPRDECQTLNLRCTQVSEISSVPLLSAIDNAFVS